MQHKTRSVQLQIKELNEDGTFEGLLSPYGNVDSGNDLVESGAFTKSLSTYGNVVPMLWQHKTDCPIGSLTVEDRSDGLYCKGQFLLDIPEAKQAYLLLKANIIKGLSIGYETIKAQVVAGVRHLKELRLYEGSIVTFPMNESAGVTSVKSKEQKGDFTEELNDRQLCDASYQMSNALQSALQQLPWSNLSREEMISAAETILQQYHDAFMEYLPNYLDFLTREYGLDTKAWAGSREAKAGRKLSKSTRDTLSEAHEHMKSAADVLSELLDETNDVEDDDIDPDTDDLETKSLVASMRQLFA